MKLKEFCKDTIVKELMEVHFTEEQAKKLYDIFWKWTDDNFLEKRLQRIERKLKLVKII